MNASRSARLRILVQLGIVLCTAGCSTHNPNRKPQLSVDDQAEALAHFSLGLLSENAGSHARALDHFQQAIRIDPAEKTLYPQAIASALREQQIDTALALCEQLRRQHPNEQDPLLLHAQVFVLAENPTAAEPLFRKAARDFPEKPDGTIALARFLVSQDQSQEALQQLERAVARHPKHAETLNLLGVLTINQAHNLQDGQDIRDTIQEGIALLEQSIELDPEDPQKFQQLGYSYLAIQNPEKALDAFQQAQKQAPSNLAVSRQILDLHIHLGQIKEALEQCDELTRQTRTDPELWSQYLIEKLPLQHREKLTEHLQEHIDTHPNAPALFFIQLGSLYLDSNETEKAATVLHAGTTLYPENGRLQTITAYLQIQKEQYEEAYTTFVAARENNPSASWVNAPAFVIQSALAAHKSGRTSEAADLLVTRLADEPNLLAGYMQMAFATNSPISADESTDLLAHIQDRIPESAEPYYYLSLIQANREEYAEALTSSQQFEALAAGNATNLLNGFFYYHYAVASERTGDLERAETLFRKAIEQSGPTMGASAQNYIAYMWAERGEKLDMGLKLIFQALETEPDNAAFIDTLGWIYYMQGRYEKALAQLKKASELVDDDPTIWEHIGDTYLKLGDPRAAVKHWKKAAELAPEASRLLERIEQHAINPDECPAPADSPADTQPHP